MSVYRYWAVRADGTRAEGRVEAVDRRGALRELGSQGLYPAALEPGDGLSGAAAQGTSRAGAERTRSGFQLGWSRRVSGRLIAGFTRGISVLLGAGIPIPQALASLGEEEEHPGLRSAVVGMAEAVRKGSSFSAALAEHPRLFSRLYVSMVRVGEEAGTLPRSLAELASLLEHEDEVRGEVLSAVAYPAFVLGFGLVTVGVLLAVVMPRLFGMLEEMVTALPWSTWVLLTVSEALQRYGGWMLLACGAGAYGVNRYLATPAGAALWDGWRLRLPWLGPLFRAAALGRFARTLGTLVHSGVSLLPALRIVEETMGNRVLAGQVARVAEETRGGDSLAAPLRKLGLFPRRAIQMIEVGEESGRLDEMLLKIAEIEERTMRQRARTLVSLLSPALILVVGALVGFMVISLLLPIFRMSRAIQ
jgi:type II secretory pathway component PulF